MKWTGSGNCRRQLQEKNTFFVTGFCELFMTVFLTQNIQSYEAWFQLSGYISVQNSRYRSSINLRQAFKVHSCNQKVGVQCAVTATQTEGSIYCDVL
jgi:transcription elongation factor Elf1